MWFCVKCGKTTPREELIRGLCRECFLQTFGVFKHEPQIVFVMCPKCRSWLYRGEWIPSTPIAEALENVLNGELTRHLIDGAELQSVNVDHYEQVNSSTLVVKVSLGLLIDEKLLDVDKNMLIRVQYKKCPRCVAKAVGKYNYLVQIRFTGETPPDKSLKQVLMAVLNAVGHSTEISVKESHEGVDLEVDDPGLAKKIMEVLSKKYSARINASFKATRYNAHQGKWIGVTTYVARIPVFKEGDIIVYRGKIGLVKSIGEGKLVLWIPEVDAYEEVGIEEYWKGALRHAVRVEKETYVVKEVNSNNVLLENPSTGEVKRVKPRGWLKSLKVDDVVSLIRADNIETLAPGELGG